MSTNDSLNESVDKCKYNTMSFALTNARSLPPKISSFVTAFEELGLDFFMVTETWISNTKNAVRNLKDLADCENVRMICKNRTKRGGGVCVAFDANKANLSRFPLPSSKWEVVCAAGKVAGFSRKIAVLCVYLPPSYTVAETSGLCDYIADALEKIKRDLQDPYICIGGDFNNRDIGPALHDFPEIAQLPGVASRQGAALDKCFTNFNDEIFKVQSHCALTNESEVPSDHLVLAYNFKLKRRHCFVTTEHRVRTINTDSVENFKKALLGTDWSFLDGKDPTDMVGAFDSLMGVMYNKAFPEKTVKVRNTDLPWVSKRIKRYIRRKKRRYRENGKSREWKDADEFLQAELRKNRQRHITKVEKSIEESGNTRSLYAALNVLKNKSPPQRWTPSALFPDNTEKETAEKCAEFFNAISSEFDQIEKPVPPRDLIEPPRALPNCGSSKSNEKAAIGSPG